MPGTFTLIKQEFQIDGVWDGPDYQARLRHFQATVGSGSTTGSDSLFSSLGAVGLSVMDVIKEQVTAIRTTIEVDSGRWEATWDLTEQQVAFVEVSTGEETAYPVHPSDGERSAGSKTLELLGIPALETPRGNVTLDSVLALLYVQQVHAGQLPYGNVNANDLQVTVEVCFKLLDAHAAWLRAQSAAAGRKAASAATALRKMTEKRQDAGLSTGLDLDVEEQAHIKDADEAKAEVLRLTRELEQHLEVLTSRQQEVSRRRAGEQDTAALADRAHRAHGEVRERLRMARETEQHARRRTEVPTACALCDQPLQTEQRQGPGPICVMCRQPDPDRPALVARRTREVAAATAAVAATEKQLRDADSAVKKAIAARIKASKDTARAQSRVDAYQAAEIQVRQLARVQASEAVTHAQNKLASVKERRRELVFIQELERAKEQADRAADDARRAWAQAEGDAAFGREQMAKELSIIFARIAIAMAPDRVRSASIDPKTFQPRINGRTLRQLARSGGLVTVAINALHLAFLEASCTLDIALPALQFLDAPLDGLGGGTEGERMADRVLDVMVDTVAGLDADSRQLVLNTPQTLDGSRCAGLHSTRLDPTSMLIPHARHQSDDA